MGKEAQLKGHTVKDITDGFRPSKTCCEVCGKRARKRYEIGDLVEVCRTCFLRHERFERMNRPLVSAEDLEGEIKDAEVVSIELAITALIGRDGPAWSCVVKTKRGEIQNSVQDTPFEAMADAFFRLPLKAAARR